MRPTARFRRQRGIAVAAAAVVLLSVSIAGCTGGPTPSPGPSPGPGCATSSGEWPTYQGNPARSADACSSINASNVAATIPRWFFPTAGNVFATPAVANGTVYVGDSTGTFYAISQSTGHEVWKFTTASAQFCFLDTSNPHTAAHEAGFGAIISSAAVATIGGRPTVFLGAGGSVFALDGRTGQCLWAQDTDPAKPASAIEVESSPVV